MKIPWKQIMLWSSCAFDYDFWLPATNKMTLALSSNDNPNDFNYFLRFFVTFTLYKTLLPSPLEKFWKEKNTAELIMNLKTKEFCSSVKRFFFSSLVNMIVVMKNDSLECCLNWIGRMQFVCIFSCKYSREYFKLRNYSWIPCRRWLFSNFSIFSNSSFHSWIQADTLAVSLSNVNKDQVLVMDEQT